MTNREFYLQILKQSQRPLIFAGNGLRISQLGQRLTHILDQLEIPMILTTHGKGSIDESHPCFYGCFGFAAPDSTLHFLKEYKADVIFFIGTSLGELASQGWHPNLKEAPLRIHIDHDQDVFRRNFDLTHRIIDSMDSFCQTLSLLQNQKMNYKIFNQYKKENYKIVEPEIQNNELQTHPICPKAFVNTLPSLLPNHTLIISDIGNSMAWLMNQFYNSNDMELFVPIGAGAMGSGIGSAMGAKLAQPQRPVICVTGDCAMIMHGNEILTGKQQNLGVVYIVLNDGGHGMVDHGQRLIGYDDKQVRFKQKVDFCKWASAFDIQSFHIRKLADLFNIKMDELLKKSEPTLLELDINSKVVPPILSRAKVLGLNSIIERNQ